MWPAATTYRSKVKGSRLPMSLPYGTRSDKWRACVCVRVWKFSPKQFKGWFFLFLRFASFIIIIIIIYIYIFMSTWWLLYSLVLLYCCNQLCFRLLCSPPLFKKKTFRKIDKKVNKYLLIITKFEYLYFYLSEGCTVTSVLCVWVQCCSYIRLWVWCNIV